jgi:hypothetical protein
MIVPPACPFAEVFCPDLPDVASTVGRAPRVSRPGTLTFVPVESAALEVSNDDRGDCKEGGLDIGVSNGFELDASDSPEADSSLPSFSRSICIRFLFVPAAMQVDGIPVRSTSSRAG